MSVGDKGEFQIVSRCNCFHQLLPDDHKFKQHSRFFFFMSFVVFSVFFPCVLQESRFKRLEFLVIDALGEQ